MIQHQTAPICRYCGASLTAPGGALLADGRRWTCISRHNGSLETFHDDCQRRVEFDRGMRALRDTFSGPARQLLTDALARYDRFMDDPEPWVPADALTELTHLAGAVQDAIALLTPRGLS